jgi:hypothetical protein
MMNKKISSREFNKKVRELFIEEVNKVDDEKRGKEVVRYNCNRYNNELCNGYKIVWKSFGSYKFEKIWRNILKEVNKIDEGWVLVDSASWRGDGNVWGMSKEYRNLELKKK